MRGTWLYVGVSVKDSFREPRGTNLVEYDFVGQTSGEQIEPLVTVLGILLRSGGDISHADSEGGSGTVFENRPRRGHGCSVRSPEALELQVLNYIFLSRG